MRAGVVWTGVVVMLLVGCSGDDGGGADEAAASVEEVAADASEGADGTDAEADDGVDDQPDGEDEAEDTTEPQPTVDLPEGEAVPLGAVAPGAYRTGAFTVPAAFEVSDDGWYAPREGPFWLGLYRDEAFESVRPDPSSFSLVGIQRPTTVDELVADLRDLEDDDFTVTEMAPTSVGGLDGIVVEAVLASNKVFGPFQSSAGQWSVWAEDRLVAIHVLETGANPVVVWIDAERDDHEAHLDRVQPILESLVFAPS